MEDRRWEVEPGLWAFLASTREVEGDAWPELYGQMSPSRRKKCDGYRRDEDKARCVLADALARQALAALSGVPPQAIVFAQDPGGKPRAPGLGLEFSLSHSGALALCAAAAFPVGADIQKARPLSPALLRRAARAGYEGSGQEDFFRWWTRQEAAGKRAGTGLALAPLPPELGFRDGTLALDGESYYYSICAARSSLAGEAAK